MRNRRLTFISSANADERNGRRCLYDFHPDQGLVRDGFAVLGGHMTTRWQHHWDYSVRGFGVNE
jgi:hypothetical protein